jgi:hypothetical protein
MIDKDGREYLDSSEIQRLLDVVGAARDLAEGFDGSEEVLGVDNVRALEKALAALEIGDAIRTHRE